MVDPCFVTETQSQEEEEPRFLLVQNRQPISKDFPHQFTVCISTMFDFSNVLQVRTHFLCFAILLPVQGTDVFRSAEGSPWSKLRARLSQGTFDL